MKKVSILIVSIVLFSIYSCRNTSTQKEQVDSFEKTKDIPKEFFAEDKDLDDDDTIEELKLTKDFSFDDNESDEQNLDKVLEKKVDDKSDDSPNPVEDENDNLNEI